MLLIAFFVTAGVYLALAVAAFAVKRWRVEFNTAAIPAAVLAGLFQLVREDYASAGIWLFITAMAAVSTYFSRRARELERRSDGWVA